MWGAHTQGTRTRIEALQLTWRRLDGGMEEGTHQSRGEPSSSGRLLQGKQGL